MNHSAKAKAVEPRRLNLTLVALGAIAIVGFLLLAGGWKAFLAWTAYWALLPQAILYRVALFRVTRTWSIIRLIATFLIEGIGIACYAYVFLHPDAQGALSFLMVPVYQMFAAVILCS